MSDKYTINDITITDIGVPHGHKYLINETLYHLPLMVTFKDGVKCNAYSKQNAVNWLNSTEATKQPDSPTNNKEEI